MEMKSYLLCFFLSCISTQPSPGGDRQHATIDRGAMANKKNTRTPVMRQVIVSSENSLESLGEWIAVTSIFVDCLVEYDGEGGFCGIGR